MRIKIIILSRLFLFGFNSLRSQSLRFYQIDDLDDYSRVLDLANEQEKLMFFVIFKDDGGFEEMIRNGVFRDDSIKTYFDQVVPVAIYRRSEMAGRLMESFGEKELPSFYVMNREEFLLNAAYGILTTEELMDFLIASMELSTQLNVLREEYRNHKLTDAEWVMLIGLYELNFDFLSTQDLAFEFLSEVPENKILNDTIKPVSLNYAISLETPYAEKILAQKNQLDSAEFSDFYTSAYSFNFDLAAENKDTVLLKRIIEVLIPAANASDSLKREMILETQILFGREAGIFSVWKKAVMQYCAQISDSSARAEFAFDEAYAIAEEFNSASAQRAARTLAHQASLWKPDYRFYMLESYMAYLMKDYEDALQVVNKAMVLAENETDTEKAQRLKTMIESDKGLE